jgi:alkanesulfonate monooxygenase SsuD/methylene tetrahydromethanopterin reductase-like flavin-dependent oxidoreductase (luciferase family)
MLPRERSFGYLGPLIKAYRDGRRETGLPQDEERISVGIALYVGASDASAQQESEAAVRRMVQRNREERAAVAALPLPVTWQEQLEQALFLAGSPATCLEALIGLHRRAPFTTLDVQPRWDGLPEDLVAQSLQRFAHEVMPALRGSVGAG